MMKKKWVSVNLKTTVWMDIQVRIKAYISLFAILLSGIFVFCGRLHFEFPHSQANCLWSEGGGRKKRGIYDKEKTAEIVEWVWRKKNGYLHNIQINSFRCALYTQFIHTLNYFVFICNNTK